MKIWDNCLTRFKIYLGYQWLVNRREYIYPVEPKCAIKSVMNNEWVRLKKMIPRCAKLLLNEDADHKTKIITEPDTLFRHIMQNSWKDVDAVNITHHILGNCLFRCKYSYAYERSYNSCALWREDILSICSFSIQWYFKLGRLDRESSKGWGR